MATFKDDPAIAAAPLKPAFPYTSLPPASATVGKLGRIYNRTGGVMELLANKATLDVASVLAVWFVESSGSDFIPGRPILRIELHKLFQHWGQANPALFDQHFRFGGHGIEGKPWQKHQWRREAAGPWQSVHIDSQDREYEVFEFAGTLAGTENACLSSSFGGPQILGSNHQMIGYASAQSMFDAFKDSERWHVAGFFDFVEKASLLDEIRRRDWTAFARGYNGAGNADVYGPKIEAAYAAAEELAQLPKQAPLPGAADALLRLDAEKAQALNLRSGPKPKPVIAVVHAGDTLRKLAEHPTNPSWWQVAVTLNGTKVTGWLQSSFLVSGPAIPADAATDEIPEAHLSPRGKRSETGGRAGPLNETDMPARTGANAAQRSAEIVAITKYLDTGKSSHLRYQPAGGKTFCNIYAYDFAFLARTYLPRVWWTDTALASIRAGNSVAVTYDVTVRELNANALFNWFLDFGPLFGWTRLFDLDSLQAQANAGAVCIIVAQRVDLNASGHIVAVVPEHEGIVATRSGGKIVQAVESQAGATNFRARAQTSQWWRGAKFRDFAFWTHP